VPAYYADSLGGIDVGLGSPTGVVFGTGAKFPSKYQRALYVLDWSYGKIYAMHLTPQGRGYAATFEPFVVAKPLPVTDAAVGPDGAFYFTVGGRGAQSGLYRVSYVGEEPTAAVGGRSEFIPSASSEAKQPKNGINSVLRDASSDAARVLRRQLESYHVRT